jgi:murein DD-endopeptidase MepM/ murein hydrolase activator NlpD
METKNIYSKPIRKEHDLGRPPSIYKHPPELEYAIDFICKIKTPIFASLEGKVVKVTNDKKVKPKSERFNNHDDAGNQILIQHANNEFSHYAHLSLHTIKVKEGDLVKQGDLIAYSGNTGFSYKPHLHFSVIRFIGKKPTDFESLEIKWKGKNK